MVKYQGGSICIVVQILLKTTELQNLHLNMSFKRRRNALRAKAWRAGASKNSYRKAMKRGMDFLF